uniref:Uncharacterized protein n=1 Tax=Arundo donax TaxID=35708 RepID=A0A0A9AZZ8_ARUDO
MKQAISTRNQLKEWNLFARTPRQ